MRVRVATLNVWGLPEPFSERPSKRLKAIGARLAGLDLDVMAFQEVWTPDARRVLSAAGHRAGLVNAWHKRSVFGGSGLLVLSRLPIAEKQFHRFTLRGLPERVDQADYYGGKGFVRIRLQTDQGPLTIIDTHLQARYAQDDPFGYRAHRAGQIVELAMAAHRMRDPIIAVGDFNMSEEQPEYAVLTGLTRLRDVAAGHGRRQATVSTENAYRVGSRRERRVDYIFARDGSQRGLASVHVERVFDEPLDFRGRRASYSNHAGVLAEFEISDTRRALTAPDRGAIALAERMLSEGRAKAERRQRGGRAWASAGIGCAVLAAAGMRSVDLSRRRLLRASLQCAALGALAPGVGLSILSEIFVPGEIRAFEALADRLGRLDPDAVEQFLA
ncbi:MAG: endonuclease/exonuclease/phosphatase family protein [Myxococcales bacterium]|nr:endonuclease/exonuclease/phosphatase family protein [Myxococcales bacterium]